MTAYHEYPPHRALAPYVACYWSMLAPVPILNRILPDACVDIVVHNAGARLVGAMRKALLLPVATGQLGLGVRFKPGGAAAFFRLPLHELTDHQLNLNELWGQTANDLAAQITELPTVSQKIAHLEALLLHRLDRLPALNPTLLYGLSLIHQAGGLVSVTTLRKELALSERQLERHFQYSTGLSPRHLARITRFQGVVQLLHRPSLSLTEVSYRAGYYDQAHFVHDFKALSGVTPRGYRREQQDVGFVQVSGAVG